MKLAHTVTISVFLKPEDDKEKVRQALVSLVPFDMEKEKVPVSEQSASGFNEQSITILEIVLKKDTQINAFFAYLKKKLGSQAALIARQAESRTDDSLFLFIRLDKRGLMGKKEHVLTDKGDCFHIRASLAAFPKKRENAVALVRRIFSG